MKHLLLPSLKMVLFYIIFLTSATNAFAQDWNQIIKVTAQNNGGSSARSAEDQCGYSVAISGNYAIVGAFLEDKDANGLNTVMYGGAAYVLYNDAGSWIQVKKIIAPIRAVWDVFGISVSIDGDYAVVGSNMEDEDALEGNTIQNAGSAYIFKKDQGGTDNWGLVKKITASTREIDDRFGASVSISGNYVIVGAYGDDDDVNETNNLDFSGSAYIFEKEQGGADNWGQIKKITASTRAIADWFGFSVSINNNYAVVGAFSDPIVSNASGSAYIFKKEQGGADNWGQIKKITVTSQARADLFGYSVSINDNYAIIGAPGEDEDANEVNTLVNAGAAYIFRKDQGSADNCGLVQKITTLSREAGDQFGTSVSINGDYAIVSAPQEDQDANELNTLNDSGSAYVFKKAEGVTGNWTQLQKITASHRASDDQFGASAAINGEYAIVGATGEDEDASEANTISNAGSAYIFSTNDPLPVTLTTFKAVKNENQALLSWATTMESNSDYFDIQKSGSGFVWKTLGRVMAAIKSDQLRTYSFIDNNPFDEDSQGYENLYRLKMVDLDGSFAYSRIISLSFGNLRRSMLYPNPVSDKLYCNPADAANIKSISIINSAGQVMFHAFEDSKAAVSVNSLTPGIYLAQIKKKAGTVQFQKIVVVR